MSLSTMSQEQRDYYQDVLNKSDIDKWNTVSDVESYLAGVNKSDAKAYAEALLLVERWCWWRDPVLIEEFYVDVARQFVFSQCM